MHLLSPDVYSIFFRNHFPNDIIKHLRYGLKITDFSS